MDTLLELLSIFGTIGYYAREPIQSMLTQEIYPKVRKSLSINKCGDSLKQEFQNCINEVINDSSLKLSEDVISELYRLCGDIANFKPFINKLSRSDAVSFEEREEKCLEILYDHYHDDYPIIPEPVFYAVISKFIDFALVLLDKEVRSSKDLITDVRSLVKNTKDEVITGNKINRQNHNKLKKMNDKIDVVIEQTANISGSRQQNTENEDISIILNEYIATKTNAISDKTNWPYDIDEESFVILIDYTKGDLQTLSAFECGKLVSPSRDIECLPYIVETLHDNPVICVGHYGMGKSTISKMLFKEWSTKNNDIYPIFLTLSFAKLSKLLNGGLDMCVAEVIDNTLKGRVKEISELINSRKLLLILDGIDESLGDNIEILEFIKELCSRNCLFFLTCRLEYTPFFDAMETFQSTVECGHGQFKSMRLLPWQKRQWDEYGNILHEKYPEKNKEIDDFLENVNCGKYSSLPTRPLFFKMLSDLHINNITKIKIDVRLQQNLSEIYYKFINWKICDDKRKKSRYRIKSDSRIFKKEGFILLKELSLLQYQPENKIKGNQQIKEIKRENRNKPEDTGVNITTIKEICRKRKFVVISEPEIYDILLQSSLFSIIRRHNETEFIFSHKSFMEYLVAYNIAEGLLTKKGSDRKPECNKNWSLFQTLEVSDHLMEEIDRIMVMYNLTTDQRDEMLLHAFQSALENVKNLHEYDPRIEEILYYIGKFELTSPKILDYLKQIIDNKECSEDYYRTTSITLARVVDRNYCDDYVLGLVDDLNHGGKRFDRNKNIQIRYYGEANLKRTLKKDLDIYVAQDPKSDIISLKILTYFTSVPQKPNEIIIDREYLQKISDAAKTLNHYKIQKLCSWIGTVIE